MFKILAQLQWKSFFRSATFGKSLAIKIFMGFMALYLLASLAFSGAMLYDILRKLVPDQSPIWTVSHYMIYWVLAEMLFRYFMQKLPVMQVKPFLINNIPKAKLVNYTLWRSALSPYNLLGIFFFLPFALVLLAKGYPALNVWCWLFSVVGIALCINYLNFLINKNNTAFFVILACLLGCYALDYFNIVNVKSLFAPVFHGLYAYPATLLLPLGVLALLLRANFVHLRSLLFLDGALRNVNSDVSSSELSWTNRFGDMAPFLRLDLRLIWRNKRTKSQVWLSLLMVFYGLIFYTNDLYASSTFMHVFVGIFMTGIFISNFGQFIPAWDSAYYSMMMSQNIPLHRYLQSKALLLTVSGVVMWVLTIPYMYFGTDVLGLNTACAVYNIGVNVPIMLYFGSYNKKRIDLNASAFSNMQGVSAVQFLLMLPVLVLPMVLQAVFERLFSYNVSIGVLLGLGLVGLVLRKPLMAGITKVYAGKKYTMISGFNQQD